MGAVDYGSLNSKPAYLPPPPAPSAFVTNFFSNIAQEKVQKFSHKGAQESNQRVFDEENR